MGGKRGFITSAYGASVILQSTLASVQLLASSMVLNSQRVGNIGVVRNSSVFIARQVSKL